MSVKGQGEARRGMPAVSGDERDAGLHAGGYDRAGHGHPRIVEDDISSVLQRDTRLAILLDDA
jgi:hypothetical protein